MPNKLLKKNTIIKSTIIILFIAFLILIVKNNVSSDCSTVLVIPITGEIVSSPTYYDNGTIRKDNSVAIDVVQKLREAKRNNKIKAVVLIVDSPGGDGESAEEISMAVKELSKPSVSIIRSYGTSAGYWIASSADRIFALPVTNTGSIGVTTSYLDNVNKNKQSGQTFHKLSYGKYKDMLNPDKHLTSEEEALVMKQLNEVANVFISSVAENRHLSFEKVKGVADGAIIIAPEALKAGLIDEIGSYADVDRYLSKKLNRKIEMCNINKIES